MHQPSITLAQLESHLWESANILRGPVDAADFKTYIFPLLFFKRICDVWDEEYQEIVDETGELCCDAMFTVGLFDLRARRLVRPTGEWAKALGLSLEDLASGEGASRPR